MPFRVAVFFALLAAAGCSRQPSAPPSEPLRHVLLVTIDTLRADRVGSYGYASARTPAFDGLARRGMRFTHAYAAAPITLPSHATMLSGRYPPRHGARHNGVVVDSTTPVLQAAFKRAGFQTAAFVSAFPLDRRFGLARDFDVYDDELPRQTDGRMANERVGAATIDRALAWLRTRPAEARLFVWVHLFEPHAPYGDPAAPSSLTASERYDNEIAAADAQVGRLLAAWPDLAHTLVIFTADHGEAFGEHGELGHSIFVYDTTLHVPLILAGPAIAAGTTVATPVSLVDLAPTIAASARVEHPPGDGVDLRAAVGNGPDGRSIYAESFAPLLDFGWAPLRSMRRDDLKLIAAPRPELYDLSADPGEARNVIDGRAAKAQELARAVEGISGADLPNVARPDAEAVARLRALGYASAAPRPSAARADPKDRIAIASRMAQVTSGELRGRDAERALRDVLREDPGNPQAHQRLGFLLAETGRCRDAEAHFSTAISAQLPSGDPYLGLAMCLAARGAPADALNVLQSGLRVEPGSPVLEANIGLLELRMGRIDLAIAALDAALRRDPDLHQARFALARALARRGRRAAALAHASELLSRLPAGAPQRPEVERLVAALR